MVNHGDIVVTKDGRIGKFYISTIEFKTTGEVEEHNIVHRYEHYDVHWTDGSAAHFQSMEEAQKFLRKANKTERFLYEITGSSTCLFPG